MEHLLCAWPFAEVLRGEEVQALMSNISALLS